MLRSTIWIIVLLAALVIISCGDDDSTDTGTDTDTDTDTDSDTDSDSDSDTNTSGYTHMGSCFYTGEAVVDAEADSYVGIHDFALVEIKNMEFGDDVCRIRFDVNYLSEAPAGCPDCSWAYTVEFSNPVTLADVDGACANSDLGMDADAIAAIDGQQISYGYAYEYTGHWHILFKYDEDTKTWVGATQSASWDDKTGELTYSSQSSCAY